jgi:hypothetical protein
MKDRRKIIRVGSSKAITIPSDVVKGEEASIALDRLMIVDLKGEISEDDLLDFLETHIEPVFWEWLRNKKKVK